MNLLHGEVWRLTMDVVVLGYGLILRGIVPVWRGGRFDVLALCLGIVSAVLVWRWGFVAELSADPPASSALSAVA